MDPDTIIFAQLLPFPWQHTALTSLPPCTTTQGDSGGGDAEVHRPAKGLSSELKQKLLLNKGVLNP